MPFSAAFSLGGIPISRTTLFCSKSDKNLTPNYCRLLVFLKNYNPSIPPKRISSGNLSTITNKIKIGTHDSASDFECCFQA
jgi:hypothetical protein